MQKNGEHLILQIAAHVEACQQNVREMAKQIGRLWICSKCVDVCQGWLFQLINHINADVWQTKPDMCSGTRAGANDWSEISWFFSPHEAEVMLLEGMWTEFNGQKLTYPDELGFKTTIQVGLNVYQRAFTCDKCVQKWGISGLLTNPYILTVLVSNSQGMLRNWSTTKGDWTQQKRGVKRYPKCWKPVFRLWLGRGK